MPHYLVETRFTLTRPQQEEFAKALTNLHCLKFGTLPLYIRVHFESLDTAKGWRNIYVAGIKAGLNAVICDDLPPGGDVEQYNELCLSIKNEWNKLFFKSRDHSWMDEKYLRAVIMKGCRFQQGKRLRTEVCNIGITSLEAELIRPLPGKEGEWLLANIEKIRLRAEAGDPSFKSLIDDIQMRNDLHAPIIAARQPASEGELPPAYGVE